MQYILLNDDQTQIINNIHVDDDTTVNLVVSTPSNLIKIEPGFTWDLATKSIIAISDAEKHDREKKQQLIDATIKSYEDAKQAAIDAALDTFTQNYIPPTE